jgi:hypothetical protein
MADGGILPSIALVQELKVARQLAVCAGKHVAQLFRSGYEVEYKDAEKTDPVTNADCIAGGISERWHIGGRIQR